MKALAALSLFVLLAGCHRGKEATPESKPAAFTSGPCDIRPLPKLTPSIAVATPKTIKFLGVVKTKTSSFPIYYYDFVNPEDNHGNFRLIVFSSRCKYLGFYSTTDDPVRIDGNKIIYHTQYPGNVVTFTGDKPPDHIWLDGDLPEFWSPEREQALYNNVDHSQG